MVQELQRNQVNLMKVIALKSMPQLRLWSFVSILAVSNLLLWLWLVLMLEKWLSNKVKMLTSKLNLENVTLLYFLIILKLDLMVNPSALRLIQMLGISHVILTGDYSIIGVNVLLLAEEEQALVNCNYIKYNIILF